jgi:hypothetical protein
MDIPKPTQEKPRMSARKKTLFLLLCLFAFLVVLYQIGGFISIFFDIPSLFPLKTYMGGSFSLGYPQNWKIASSDSDGITVQLVQGRAVEEVARQHEERPASHQSRPLGSVDHTPLHRDPAHLPSPPQTPPLLLECTRTRVARV